MQTMRALPSSRNHRIVPEENGFAQEKLLAGIFDPLG